MDGSYKTFKSIQSYFGIKFTVNYNDFSDVENINFKIKLEQIIIITLKNKIKLYLFYKHNFLLRQHLF